MAARAAGFEHPRRHTGFSPAAPGHVTSKRPSPRPVNTKTLWQPETTRSSRPSPYQIARLDRGGRASGNGVEAVEQELCGGVGGWRWSIRTGRGAEVGALRVGGGPWPVHEEASMSTTLSIV